MNIHDEVAEFSEAFLEKHNTWIQTEMDFLQEECAELIQAISKDKRGKPYSRDMIIEEMCHVLISIQNVRTKYNISDEDLFTELQKKIQKYL